MATNVEPREEKRPRYKRAILYGVGLVGAFVLAIVTGLADPVVEAIVNWASPSQAAVEGYVYVEGDPAEGLLVVRDREYDWNAAYREVDGRYSTYTNDHGHFILTGLNAGTHTILVYQFRSSNGDLIPTVLHSDNFYLPSSVEKMNLSRIEID